MILTMTLVVGQTAVPKSPIHYSVGEPACLLGRTSKFWRGWSFQRKLWRGDHKDSLATENIPWRHKAVWWYRQISPKNISSRLWMFESETEACLAFVYKGLSAPHISTMMTCPIQNSSFQTHQQEAISLFSTGTSIMVVIDVLFSKQCCSSSSPRICRAYMEVEHPPLACCGGRGFYWEWSGAFFPFLHRFYSSLYTADWWKRALTEIIRLQRLLSLSRGKWGWCRSQARSI